MLKLQLVYHLHPYGYVHRYQPDLPENLLKKTSKVNKNKNTKTNFKHLWTPMKEQVSNMALRMGCCISKESTGVGPSDWVFLDEHSILEIFHRGDYKLRLWQESWRMLECILDKVMLYIYSNVIYPYIYIYMHIYFSPGKNKMFSGKKGFLNSDQSEKYCLFLIRYSQSITGKIKRLNLLKVKLKSCILNRLTLMKILEEILIVRCF